VKSREQINSYIDCHVANSRGYYVERAILEALLDIRDLLSKESDGAASPDEPGQ
jgi:hypothetical protein